MHDPRPNRLNWNTGFRRLTLLVSMLTTTIALALLVTIYQDYNQERKELNDLLAGKTPTPRLVLLEPLQEVRDGLLYIAVGLGYVVNQPLAVLVVLASFAAPWLGYFLLSFILRGFLPRSENHRE